jgi:hypothetical protein
MLSEQPHPSIVLIGVETPLLVSIVSSATKATLAQLAAPLQAPFLVCPKFRVDPGFKAARARVSHPLRYTKPASIPP